MTPQEMEATIAELQNQVSELRKKYAYLDDINQVKRLQRAYSYYVMRMMKQEVIDCFAEHPETALYWLEGAYLGKDAVKRYFETNDPGTGQPADFFHQVMPIAGVVDVEGDRAWGRWYTFGSHSLPAGDGTFRKSWVAGVYEIEYIKQDGVWKFLVIRWYIPYTVTIPDELWRWPDVIRDGMANPRRPFPVADVPFDYDDPRFMSGYILPFHYKHPVTGKEASYQENNERIIREHKARQKP